MSETQLLSGVRIIESSLLGPGLISTFFSDLGADVIKVEPPQGDYIRQMTWPIIDGVSLLHLHTHRGKKSVALNLKTDEGKSIYKELVEKADAVVEEVLSKDEAEISFDTSQLDPLSEEWEGSLEWQKSPRTVAEDIGKVDLASLTDWDDKE